MDLLVLGEFLRSHRRRIRPAEAGLGVGARRRVPGLRRDEVALLAGISLDYYVQLEQGGGACPSDHSLAGLARALRLSSGERAELFRLAGRTTSEATHVPPALLTLLDRLGDAPALVLTDLVEVLVQNPLSIALVGDRTAVRGLPRSFIYQWFTDPATRKLFPAEDHPAITAALMSDLRKARSARADRLASVLRLHSKEFATRWDTAAASVEHADRTRFLHRSLGVIELDTACLSTTVRQRLLWFTAPPGSPAVSQLELLNVIGSQDLRPERR